MYDLCIIGGGASGMCAAIKAKQINRDLRVVILEKNGRLGRKLLATGNGRCNLTNKNCQEYRRVLEFFESIGVLTKTDQMGRIYPYSEEASEIVNALETQLNSLGVEVRFNSEVSGITVTSEGFQIAVDPFGVEAKKLLVATGGKSAPEYGTTGDGYIIARKLGHAVTKLVPVLTSVECEGDFTRFKGIRQDALVKLCKDGEVIAEENGNLQMTEYGLSGICIFDLTRYITVEEDETVDEAMGRYAFKVDFLPEVPQISVEDILKSRIKIKNMDAISILRTLVKTPIGKDILAKIGIEPRELAVTLSPAQVSNMAALLKNWSCKVKKVKGWQFAQVTRGGVPLEEINAKTMESKLISGMYFTGEVIDYDGPCGGYNLQNAWNTALTAGEAIGNHV